MATAQGVPEDVLPPLVEFTSAREIRFKAQPPGTPNGVILLYSIKILQIQQEFNSTAPEEFSVDGKLISLCAWTACICSAISFFIVGKINDYGHFGKLDF